MDKLRRRKEMQVTETRWSLIGSEGAVSFTVFDLGCASRDYHSAAPLHETHRPIPCDVLGRDCYAGSSFAAGVELRNAWLTARCDDALIWAELERYYGVVFEPAKKVAS